MSIIAGFAVPHPPLIIPQIGQGEERAIAATIAAYRSIAKEIAELDPDVVVVSSPHAPYFRDAFHLTTDSIWQGNMGRFYAPQVRISAEVDTELTAHIGALAQKSGLSIADSRRKDRELDHGTFIPLYFIREAYAQKRAGACATSASADKLPVPIVRVGLSLRSFEDHRLLGRCIERAIDELGRSAVFVASGDLSHKLLPEGPYGFAAEGPEFDQRFCEIVESGDLEELFLFDEDFCEAAAECGLRSFQIMCGALGLGAGRSVFSRLLSHEGPFGVGYGVARFIPEPPNLAAPAVATDAADPYVELARASLEAFVKDGSHIQAPPNLPAELSDTRAGAFVSIHKLGQLRGCIGTIGPVQNSLAEEIIENAIAAAAHDPRFDPITPDELDFLEISVDVLGKTESISGLSELDPERYGVIVTKGWRRGLLLPRLEGITDAAEQVAIAAQKAGLSPFERGLRLERFEVVRHTKGGEARKSGVVGERA